MDTFNCRRLRGQATLQPDGSRGSGPATPDRSVYHMWTSELLEPQDIGQHRESGRPVLVTLALLANLVSRCYRWVMTSHMQNHTVSGTPVRWLPSQRDAARFIGIDASGITRAVSRLGITPLAWGNREKHLRIADVLRVGVYARRASLEEIAGALLEWAATTNPEAAPLFTAQIDQFFAALPAPQPSGLEAVLADIHEAAVEAPVHAGARDYASTT